jgi:hypothetical protein
MALRVLSILGDKYKNEGPTMNTYDDFVKYLNGLNADWVKAMQRVSPQMLIALLEYSRSFYYRYFQALPP